jgi:hypothetical protein
MRWFFVLFIILVAILLVMSVVMTSKNQYQYEIYMNDGTIEYAWEVSCTGGVMFVKPHPGITESYYYLSQTQYKKIVYVGTHTLKK